MKVLLVSSGSGARGGGEIFLDYLGKGLSERGHDVLLWIPKHSRMDELAEKCARFARVIRADYHNTYDYRGRSLSTCFNWGNSLRIACEWKGLQPDVIHINKQNLEDGLDLLRAARYAALPNVCTIHLTQTSTYLRARAGWLRDWIARFQLGRYKGVLVAVQERRREMLQYFLPGARTTTIFNGVPGVEASALRSLRVAKRKELGLSARDFLVLGVGRLVEQKRPFLFLRIADELRRRLPGMRFLWVGDGKLAQQWKKTIVDEGLEGAISCAGWQANVLPYLAAGDLLLHVAEFEGLPFVMIEAMSAGLPCAVTRDLSSEIPFLDESNVLFVDDVEELAEKLRHSLVIEQVGKSGRCLVEDKLSVKKMAESYGSIYADAIARCNGGVSPI